MRRKMNVSELDASRSAIPGRPIAIPQLSGRPGMADLLAAKPLFNNYDGDFSALCAKYKERGRFDGKNIGCLNASLVSRSLYLRRTDASLAVTSPHQTYWIRPTTLQAGDPCRLASAILRARSGNGQFADS